MGTTQSVIARLEIGRRMPGVRTLQRLAAARQRGETELTTIAEAAPPGPSSQYYQEYREAEGEGENDQ